MDLLAQVQQALAEVASYSTDQLNQLNQACGKDPCHRRERIVYQLQRYAAQYSVIMASTSTTHRFKRDFADPKHYQANIEVNGQTKAVSATNLTDEDVPLLQQYGYGHFLEKLPEPEKPQGEDENGDHGDDEHDGDERTAESLGKLKKDALHALHTEVVGLAAKSDAKKDELIAAILAADTPKE